MTRSRHVFLRTLTSCLLACLWCSFYEDTRTATADEQDATNKPAASTDAKSETAKPASDTAATDDDDPDKKLRTEKYNEKREIELQHAVKEQSDAYLELEKRDEQFQTYLFIGAGVIVVVVVGLWLFSRVRKK